MEFVLPHSLPILSENVFKIQFDINFLRIIFQSFSLILCKTNIYLKILNIIKHFCIIIYFLYHFLFLKIKKVFIYYKTCFFEFCSKK